jgi:hypothetical protein
MFFRNLRCELDYLFTDYNGEALQKKKKIPCSNEVNFPYSKIYF